MSTFTRKKAEISVGTYGPNTKMNTVKERKENFQLNEINIVTFQ